MKKVIYLFILLIISCGSPQPSDQDLSPQKSKIVATEVKATIVKKGKLEFNNTYLGKARSMKKANIRFGVPGILEIINYKNGDFVEKGQIIALLDNSKFVEDVEMKKIVYQQSILKYKDVLIGMGYDPNNNDISKSVVDLAKIKSGLAQAKLELNNAKSNLKQIKLIAPFSGILANIQNKTHEFITKNIFCTLIDNSRFDIEFYIMQEELSAIRKEQKIWVIPLSNSSCKLTGHIKSINPMVNTNGFIKVTGEAFNKQKKLIDGMNVNIELVKEEKHCLYIPKKAVLFRGNENVVFKLINGVARWTDITLGGENKEYYQVLDGIKENDTIAISNHLFMNDKTPVTIKSLDN